MTLVRSLLLPALMTFGLSAGASSLQAQMPMGARLKAHVPFSFMVEGRSMSAGDYQLTRLPSSSISPFLLVLTNDTTGDTAILQTTASRSNDPAPETALFMKDIGGQYYLSKIAYGGEVTGSELPIHTKKRDALGKTRAIYLSSSGR